MASGETGPRIKGGSYDAIDTQDGFVLLRNMPSMSTVPKGVKGAPEDIQEEWMGDAVKFGSELYDKGNLCYPIHLGHNDDQGLTRPEFAGYFRPTRVGKGLVEGKEQPVVFSDWKLKKPVFDKMAKGELGFVSPEVRSWGKRRISSLALLDSQPPHFGFPLQTIGKVTVDPAATFSADLPKGCTIAKFEDGVERIKFEDFDPMDTASKAEPKPTEHVEKCCSHCKQNQDTLAKMSKDLYGGKMEAGKPDSAPVEQKAAEPTKQGAMANIRMEDDPKAVARFAALEDKYAALEKKLTERESAEKAKALGDKVLADDLRGYQIGEKTKQAVYRFAAEGENKLKEYVESVREVAIKDSPRSLHDAELAGAVKLNDPVLAKFSQGNPAKMEVVARFAADYRTLKASPAGRGMRISEEEWITQAVKEAELGGKI